MQNTACFLHHIALTHYNGSFSGGASGKEPACQCRRGKRHEFDPCVGKIPWRRKWQPTPVSFPGESHGQRSLAGDSPLGHEELYMTEMRAYTHVMLAIHLL